MPRRALSYIGGMPYHIVQRGNNRQVCFFESSDYTVYLDLWQSCSKRYGVAVHAYCLMSNHIHFLVTPDTEIGISNTMKVVGSRYAQIINQRYKRTGSLWEGRHKSSLVDSDRYLLSCYQYIELNPVRACMVQSPNQYSWSSYIRNSTGNYGWITPHDSYLSLGVNTEKRSQGYQQYVNQMMDSETVSLIRKASHYCQPVGDDDFKQRMEVQFGLQPGQMRTGRPSQ